MSSGKPNDEGDAARPVAATGDDRATGAAPRPGATQAVDPTALIRIAAVAPEASQGAWRERVFAPRRVMSRDAVRQALEVALALGSEGQGPALAPAARFEALLARWLPALRQAVEQAGGDGLDAWLLWGLKGEARPPRDGLWMALIMRLAALRDAPDAAAQEQAARAVVALVDEALGVARPRRLSLRQLERELEGKLQVDEVLAIVGRSSEALLERLGQLTHAMEQIRGEVTTQPGPNPDGMYANFVRMKAEARVVAAELRLRGVATSEPLPQT